MDVNQADCNFLPASASEIQDSAAQTLLQQIRRQPIEICTDLGKVNIPTAFACTEPASIPSPQRLSPMLCLPGFDSSLLEYRYLLPLLAGQQQCWAVDWYGCGFTAYNPRLTVHPVHIRQHLFTIIRRWIGQPVMLIGASLGGAVALDFALHHPEFVKALVLLDSVGFSGHFPLGASCPSAILEVGADWLHLRKQMTLTAALALSMPSLVVEGLRCAQLHQQMPGWKNAITTFCQSGGYADLSSRIGEVSQPTLLLWGVSDDVLGTGDALRFRQAIPESQLVWVSQAGHAPHIEQPHTVAKHLLSFAT
ncbi:Lipase 3 [Acaryochloris thomasi RCC1774]|uniref:Lipase 3 n=1 Tax=Acaryochloris thomasi RCC1774 TaxID=1764569 RepID=A0A2W1JFS6_9CYAN|nr:alpha/beta hydrolase [Acaryochloris thomasi]PZD70525.1 Lipase 3 [Acaryochloris thomasi RCC1774]